jgi:hypothetical protein
MWLVAISAVVLAVGFGSDLGRAHAQPPGGDLRVVRVPANTNFTVDLSKRGVIFVFDSKQSTLDLSRITIRTATGQLPMRVWLKERVPSQAISRWETATVRVGYTSDMAKLIGKGRTTPKGPPGVIRYECDASACTCHGDADCNDMFSTNVCGPIAWCIENDDTCHCSRH